ncbi:MAG: hypothetical protein KJO69_10095 [Gammaproteobacteria bacterium]|nr:hypothetical protein [Gammaproteobacteria bacterium]NNJ72395.1 hypothetical protein [Enterobacterales bacterium]
MSWLQILGLIAGIMFLVFMWPAYKHYSKNSPEAKEGDWMAAIIPLGAVALLVIFLVLSV